VCGWVCWMCGGYAGYVEGVLDVWRVCWICGEYAECRCGGMLNDIVEGYADVWRDMLSVLRGVLDVWGGMPSVCVCVCGWGGMLSVWRVCWRNVG
jgi:hypothetical protein